jgi:hypothetical protein
MAIVNVYKKVFLDQSSYWRPSPRSSSPIPPHTEAYQAGARNMEGDNAAA